MYFLLTGAVGLLVELACRPAAAVMARGVTVLLVFLSALFVTVKLPAPVTFYVLWKRLPQSPHQQAFHQVSAQPGLYYFADMPLVSLMAEKRLYHFSHALSDRDQDGFRISKEHFLSVFPSTLRAVFLSPDGWKDYMLKQDYLNEFPNRNDLPGGWIVLSR